MSDPKVPDYWTIVHEDETVILKEELDRLHRRVAELERFAEVGRAENEELLAFVEGVATEEPSWRTAHKARAILAKSDHNKRLIDRIKGMPAQPGDLSEEIGWLLEEIDEQKAENDRLRAENAKLREAVDLSISRLNATDAHLNCDLVLHLRAILAKTAKEGT